MNDVQWYVGVVESDTGKVVETLGPMSERKAERVERGLLINMDVERFHVDMWRGERGAK